MKAIEVQSVLWKQIKISITSFIVLFSRFFWVQLFCSIIVSGFLLLVALRALHCTAGQTKAHCVGQGTERGRRKFWERRISMIYLCCKYVKNCNIFGQILNIWVKLILKKKNSIFFFNVYLCLRTPKVLAYLLRCFKLM